MTVSRNKVTPNALQGIRSVSRIADEIDPTKAIILGGSPTVFAGDSPNNTIKSIVVSPSIGDAIPPFEVVIYDEGFVRDNEMT